MVLCRIIHFPLALLSLCGFKHNGKKASLFHALSLYSIHNPEDEIANLPPNRGEFFLKQDPNYAQPQISMFNATKCFNKE